MWQGLRPRCKGSPFTNLFGWSANGTTPASSASLTTQRVFTCVLDASQFDICKLFETLWGGWSACIQFHLIIVILAYFYPADFWGQYLGTFLAIPERMALQPIQIETFLGSFMKLQPSSAPDLLANNVTFTFTQSQLWPWPVGLSSLAKLPHLEGRSAGPRENRPLTKTQSARVVQCVHPCETAWMKTSWTAKLQSTHSVV